MMRRIIAVVAVVVVLGSGCRAEAGLRVRIVNYNVAKLNSENPDNPNCVPGSMSVVIDALNDDDKPGFALPPDVYVCQGRFLLGRAARNVVLQIRSGAVEVAVQGCSRCGAAPARISRRCPRPTHDG